MKIIPSVNCADKDCFLSRARAASQFSDWMHIDVSDGKFTRHLSFGAPSDVQALIENESAALLHLKKTKMEVHLMVKTPAEYLVAWAAAGIARAVIHLESANTLDEVASICLKSGIVMMLALNPETAIDKIDPFLEQYGVSFIQILAVFPGLSGQSLIPEVLLKVKTLKRNHPEVIVEVDGGINADTVRLARDAGADIAVSASYIFESADPRRAYGELLRAASF